VEKPWIPKVPKRGRCVACKTVFDPRHRSELCRGAAGACPEDRSRTADEVHQGGAGQDPAHASQGCLSPSSEFSGVAGALSALNRHLETCRGHPLVQGLAQAKCRDALPAPPLGGAGSHGRGCRRPGLVIGDLAPLPIGMRQAGGHLGVTPCRPSDPRQRSAIRRQAGEPGPRPDFGVPRSACSGKAAVLREGSNGGVWPRLEVNGARRAAPWILANLDRIGDPARAGHRGREPELNERQLDARWLRSSAGSDCGGRPWCTA
jgi:hypothetical protein